MRLLSTLSALVGTCAATSLHLSISPSSSLLDLSELPSSTHATLYGPSGKRATAPLRVDNSFVFNGLEEGEWLLDVHSRDHVFPSLRVDVVDPVSILPIKQEGDGEAAPVASTPETVVVYLTHPSNKWSHLGAKIAASTAPLSSTDQVKLSVSALGKRAFYEQRQGFDLLSFFKNPMILMGVLSMGLVFGMPYLMENSKFILILFQTQFARRVWFILTLETVDEETKAEFAEMQKQGPLGLAGGAGGQGQNTAQQIQNFDLAGWMAGKK